MLPIDVKPMPHAELLQASLRGDRIFGMILPFNSLPPMTVDVIRVEQDSVVVQHWNKPFRVGAGDARFAFWSVPFQQVCTEYRRAGWGHVFDVLDDAEERQEADLRTETQIAVLGDWWRRDGECLPIEDVKRAVGHFSDNFSNTVLFHDKNGDQHVINGYCYRNPKQPTSEP